MDRVISEYYEALGMPDDGAPTWTWQEALRQPGAAGAAEDIEAQYALDEAEPLKNWTSQALYGRFSDNRILFSDTDDEGENEDKEANGNDNDGGDELGEAKFEPADGSDPYMYSSSDTEDAGLEGLRGAEKRDATVARIVRKVQH